MTDRIIIVGAGAAGLMAAVELSRFGKRVVLLEALPQIGGRAHAIDHPDFEKPVERGAEFVHGNLPLTLSLLKEAGILYTRMGGKMHRFMDGRWTTEETETGKWSRMLRKMKNLKADMPFAEFLEQYFPGDAFSKLRIAAASYASGFDLADTERSGTIDLGKEWSHEEDDLYRIEGGYRNLMEFLASSARSLGCTIITSAIVRYISWKPSTVKITTASGEIFEAGSAILTLSPALLSVTTPNDYAIRFEQVIENHRLAASSLGFGSVIKVILRFKSRFWENYIDNPGFILSDQAIPTWWTQLPDASAVLTGWLGGPEALKPEYGDDQKVLNLAMESLSNIFSLRESELQQLLVASLVGNWSKAEYALGGYSSPTPGGAAHRNTLNNPINNTLYFAGEALYEGNSPGTVEAALATGKSVAGTVIATGR